MNHGVEMKKEDEKASNNETSQKKYRQEDVIISTAQRHGEEAGAIDAYTHKVQEKPQEKPQEKEKETEKEKAPVDVKEILAMLDAAIPQGKFKKRGRPRKNPENETPPTTITTTTTTQTQTQTQTMMRKRHRKEAQVQPMKTSHLSTSIETAAAAAGAEVEDNGHGTKRATSTGTMAMSLQAKQAVPMQPDTTIAPTTQMAAVSENNNNNTKSDTAAEVVLSIEMLTQLTCAAILRLSSASSSISIMDIVNDVDDSLVRRGLCDEKGKMTEKDTAQTRMDVDKCVRVLHGLGYVSIESAGSVTVVDTKILFSAFPVGTDAQTALHVSHADGSVRSSEKDDSV